MYPWPHLAQYGLGNRDEYEKLYNESGIGEGGGFTKLNGHDIFFIYNVNILIFMKAFLVLTQCKQRAKLFYCHLVREDRV